MASCEKKAGETQERPASLLRRASRGGPYTSFEPSTFNYEPLFSPKSNYSRTYEPLSRKSNDSRTYAKTGGWGSPNQMCSPLTLLFSSTMLTNKVSTIVGAPTFAFLCGTKDKPKNRSEDRPLQRRESYQRPATSDQEARRKQVPIK